MTTVELIEEQARLGREREKLKSEKRQIQVTLSELTNTVRAKRLSHTDYERLCKSQNEEKRRLNEIEGQLSENKFRMRELADMKYLSDNGNRELRPPSDNPEEEDFQRGVLRSVTIDLVALRSAYQVFAADPTRVSSMRTMAAEFVNKLNPIIRRACGSQEP